MICCSRISKSEFASISSRRAGSATVSADEMAQPTPGLKHSSHQPSSTEQLRAPFMAAFMPDVPHAS